MDRRALAIVVAFAAALAALVVLRLLIGSGGTLALPESAQVWRLRLDRVAAGIVVGGCLGLGGVVLQALLRNPLASPDLIGASAGAGLGVMIATLLAASGASVGDAGPGVVSAGVLGGINLGAGLVGAAAALGVVYLLSQRRGYVEPVHLVLVGVMVSVIAGAGTVLVAQLTPDRGLAAQRWMMGALTDDIPLAALIGAAAVLAVSMVLCVRWARSMDLASLGDDEARSLGVHVARLRLAMFALAAALSAAAVAVAGPIGFVGLVAPHAARLLAGPGHRGVVWAAPLAGAALVVGADILVRGIDLGGGRLPIGVITALVGGPVFLLMLKRGGDAMTR